MYSTATLVVPRQRQKRQACDAQAVCGISAAFLEMVSKDAATAVYNGEDPWGVHSGAGRCTFRPCIIASFTCRFFSALAFTSPRYLTVSSCFCCGGTRMDKHSQRSSLACRVSLWVLTLGRQRMLTKKKGVAASKICDGEGGATHLSVRRMRVHKLLGTRHPGLKRMHLFPSWLLGVCKLLGTPLVLFRIIHSNGVFSPLRHAPRKHRRSSRAPCHSCW